VRAAVVQPFPPPAELGGQTWAYYPETGHYVANGFKAYFDANGGLASFGYPITEELNEDGWTVQYFQRARLEYHPESQEAPVQRALLGDMLVREYDARGDQRGVLPVPAVAAPPPGARTFPETGAWIAAPVLDFFDRNGGIATFGFPVAAPADGTQWFQRARIEWTGASVSAALIGDEFTDAAGLAPLRERAAPPRLARANPPRGQADVPVYAGAGDAAPVTRLPLDAQVRVTGEVRQDNGAAWYAVRLWNALDGFVAADTVAFTAAPGRSESGGGGAPWRPPQPPAQGPFPVSFDARAAAESAFAGEPDGPQTGTLAAREALRVAAWATDAQGHVWYRFVSGDRSGWTLAQSIFAVTPDPLTATDAGRPLAAAVSGKGMWFTYDVLRQTPVQQLIAAAQANGLAFLAPEVGTSRSGYWARGELDALLSAAHAAGLKVIPWVYPWMADLPADLDLAVRAATHVAPSGDRVDGLGVDVEENLDEATNRAYGQLLRAAVGPRLPLIAITFQPQIAAGQRTPYAALAESYNVIAPMSYWHGRPVRYSSQDAYAYVAESIRAIRARIGRSDVPIAVLGQTFDWFSRNQIGAGSPSGEEIRGSLQAARDLGALGIGYFNWFHTTPDEWDAIAGFEW
jgi:hypothetical protein